MVVFWGNLIYIYSRNCTQYQNHIMVNTWFWFWLTVQDCGFMHNACNGSLMIPLTLIQFFGVCADPGWRKMAASLKPLFAKQCFLMYLAMHLNNVWQEPLSGSTRTPHFHRCEYFFHNWMRVKVHNKKSAWPTIVWPTLIYKLKWVKSYR